MNLPRKPRTARRQTGVTLIESLIVLLVAVVTLSASIPSLEQLRQRRQLESAAAQLETDLQHARSLAISMARPVRMSFRSSAHGSCYVVHTGAAADCSCSFGAAAVCRGTAQALQSAQWSSGTLRLSSNSSSILFDDSRGTVTPTATVRLQTATHAVHQVVNLMGRVRSCSPAPALPGYKAC